MDVERAEQELAQVLDRLERPVETLGQARPWLPKLLVELHLGPRQGGEGDPMRGQRPTDEADPAAERDDRAEDAGIGRTAQGAFVEAVDLALHPLDELEVVGEDLVGDGRQETGRVERAKPRLAFGRGIEPGERPDRAVVDGDDPIPPGDDVDRPPDRRLRLIIGGRRLHRDEGQMEVVGIRSQVGAARGCSPCEPRGRAPCRPR